MLKNAQDESVEIIHQKRFIAKKYEKLENEKPSAWIADNNLKPLKVFEMLFGNNFERIRNETERYAQRRGSSISVSRWLK